MANVSVTFDKHNPNGWEAIIDETHYTYGIAKSIELDAECTPPLGWDDIDPRVQEAVKGFAGERIFTLTIDNQILFRTTETPDRVETENLITYTWPPKEK